MAAPRPVPVDLDRFDFRFKYSDSNIDSIPIVRFLYDIPEVRSAPHRLPEHYDYRAWRVHLEERYGIQQSTQLLITASRFVAADVADIFYDLLGDIQSGHAAMSEDGGRWHKTIAFNGPPPQPRERGPRRPRNRGEPDPPQPGAASAEPSESSSDGSAISKVKSLVSSAGSSVKSGLSNTSSMIGSLFGSQSSSSGDDDDEEGESDIRDEIMDDIPEEGGDPIFDRAGVSMNINDNTWAQVCRFFNCDIGAKQVTIPGLHLSPKDYQMYAIYFLLHQPLGGNHAAIIADDIGFAKTGITLVTIFLYSRIQLVAAEMEYERRHRISDGKRRHLRHPKKGGVCPSQDRLGFRCPCSDPGGLASRIARHFDPNPCIIVCSPNLIQQWEAEAAKWYDFNVPDDEVIHIYIAFIIFENTTPLPQHSGDRPNDRRHRDCTI
ncbi:uncharacterized protein F4822DRAFT_444239 [Hypoxylon trugodes]|uniref:uncharacterized protein n=1 Tax=Hypoxylon trugodes TaxID=326681 RepID=UPI0021946E0C|nr:uncharacterized protein F4822DRAFT_444239 [Hypoxylon trugodes]KAI1387627.1 hypothetical protein F4822DRAFT_444239 [Hypoxylon trugodes]